MHAGCLGASSAYDATLPDLRLGQVHIEAQSLPQAWKTIATDLLLRSVLVLGDDAPVDHRFVFDADRPRARDVFDALVASYPGFTWTQDARSGVVWILPRTVPYESILPARIDAPANQPGLPMQSGILDAIAGDPVPGVETPRWDGIFQNTFDYPVDVPRGRHTVRDLLNAACAANPTKTFLVRHAGDRATVTAVNTIPEGRDVPPGAVHFWTAATGTPGSGEPTHAEVVAAAGDSDPRRRWAARCWIEIRAWSFPIDALVREKMPPEHALWFALATTSVFVRNRGATRVAAIERMRREATAAFLARGDPALAVLTAIELARITGDLTALNAVTDRRIPRATARQVGGDVLRSARGAPEAAQAAVRAHAADWLGAAADLPPPGASWRTLRFTAVTPLRATPPDASP